MKGGKGEREQGCKEVSKNCDDKECKDWSADGCTYTGRYTKGMCKRKYMQQYYKDKKWWKF